MKKVLAIIAAAVLFGGVAGATVLGISYVSGVGSNVAEQSETTVENNT